MATSGSNMSKTHLESSGPMLDNGADADMAFDAKNTDIGGGGGGGGGASSLSSSAAEAAPSSSFSPPTRLIITQMVLENFKSYAGVKTIGPFHKSFSSVVGPNGSGKSNVIDAMLFVFGKRAKKLRLNKVSELIHSSDAYRDDPLQYAKVSVHFCEIYDDSAAEDGGAASTGGDNGCDSYRVVEGSEAVVSRVARRDNSSNYQLDGRSAPFKKVAEFLHSKGIDLDNNRFLILQGEVEMISMMPPKGKDRSDGGKGGGSSDEGLLEYLEDIIGSGKYVEDADNAAVRVDTLTDQRQEKLHRVKAAEKEKESLEGAKAEAEALLGKEREVRRKKHVLYQINALKCRRAGSAASDDRARLTEELDGRRDRQRMDDERVLELDEKLSELRKAHSESSAELKVTKEEFTAYERQDIKLRETIKHEKSLVKKVEGKVKAETTKAENAEKARSEADDSIGDLQSLIEEWTERKSGEDDALEATFEETRKETFKLRAELEAKTSELSPLQQERAVYQNSLDTAETEVHLLEDAVSRASEQLKQAEKELSSLDGRQKKKREELSKLSDELEKSRGRVVEAEREARALEAKEGELGKGSSELTMQAEQVKASLHSTRGRSAAVSAILAASRKGKELANVGILGRLGDLATIDSKYDVAVSTAVGMLDHVVVQTTAGTQRCLEFLRRHNLGRASFIPLDKMKKGAHDRAVETPENASRLFDLISPAHFGVAPALFLAVGNTLVASDLESATRLAYEFGKRWRVVTLDGKLIETSGTMSGGGKLAKKGRMKLSNGKKGGAPSILNSNQSMAESSATIEDCRKLESEAKKAQEELQTCRQQRRALIDEVRTLNRRIKSLEVKLPQLEMEIDGFDTTRTELTNRLPALREQSVLSESDAKKRDELSKKVETCKSDMASCALAASKLEGKVGNLQKAILNAGGAKLKNQQKACDEAKMELVNANKKLNSAKSTISNSKKAVIKAEKAKKMAEADLDKSVVSLKKAAEEQMSLEKGALEVMQAYEEVKEREAEKRTELEGASKEFDELKQALAKSKCTEVELVGKIDTFDKQLKEIEKKQAHWERETEKLRVLEEQEESEYNLLGDDEGDGTNDESEDGNGDETKERDNESKGDEIVVKTKAVRGSDSSLPMLSAASLEQYDRDSIMNDIAVLEKERDSLAKNANMGAIEEYRKKESDYLLRVSDLDKITSERNDARRVHEELRKMRLEKFMVGFSKITLKLKEMYQMITLGGDAELELVDSLDPFSEGIVFSVRPPKKSWKNIANLSGGEKTLSSLALVFALHHYKPTPLYVMDEIDAALDFKNVSIVAHYIKERTKNAQFIIISLRNNMFELADRLVGIYKTNNCTKSVTINPRCFGKQSHTTNGSKVESEEPGPVAAPLADKTNASGSACA